MLVFTILETYSDDTDSTTVHGMVYIAVNPAILKLGVATHMRVDKCPKRVVKFEKFDI
jgi:hypothetical protein